MQTKKLKSVKWLRITRNEVEKWRVGYWNTSVNQLSRVLCRFATDLDSIKWYYLLHIISEPSIGKTRKRKHSASDEENEDSDSGHGSDSDDTSDSEVSQRMLISVLMIYTRR